LYERLRALLRPLAGFGHRRPPIDDPAGLRVVPAALNRFANPGTKLLVLFQQSKPFTDDLTGVVLETSLDLVVNFLELRRE
jgi:hypothetical protein